MKSIIPIGLILSIFLSSAFMSASTPDSSAKNNFTFRIELCRFTNEVPVKMVELLRSVRDISIRKENNRTIYLTKPFKDLASAQYEVPKYRSFGFDQAKEIVESGNQILSVEEYYELTNSTTGEDNRAIRIYED